MTNEASVDELKRLLFSSRSVVVLSGAGMSTESGIPDFRSPTGVWQDEDLMESMSDGYLKRHPEEFWPKFKLGFMSEEYLSAKPNPGHLALADLEKMGKDIAIYTQNVDGLHQEAGSRHVYELHGSIKTAYCPRCRSEYGLEYILSEEVPRCHWMNPKGQECDTILFPDTVLFGQNVRHYEYAAISVQQCDLMLVLGTSLTVYPVADLPEYVRRDKTKLAIVNLDETDFDSKADVVIHGKVGEVLSQAVKF